MTRHSYIPEGVCSSEISFEIEDGALRNVQFTDGCSGNSQAIGRLCEGMHVDDVIRLLKGIDCEDKGTSCPDQLSKALENTLTSKGGPERPATAQKP
jgi:uncharacterized protein (TIGR03905 family)